jgi:hypothetical protein
MLKDTRDQRIKKMILVRLIYRRRICGHKRLYGNHRPAHWGRSSAGIHKEEGIEAIECGVLEAGRYGTVLDDLHCLHGFGVAREKCLHFCRIGFMRLRVGLRDKQIIEEP